MKKLFFPILALMAFGFGAQAQTVKYGVKAGVNVSTYTGDDADGAESIAGAHAGMTIEIKVSEKFSVQPEVLFSMQGAKASYSGLISPTIVADAEVTSRLNYIAVPVMAKFYAAKGFSIEAGPQIAFLVSAKNKVEGSAYEVTSGFSQNINSKQDAKDMFKSTDFGMNVGAGYQFDSGLFLQARYLFGLSDIGKSYTESGEAYEAAKMKNSVFAFSVGFRFE